MTRKRKKKKKTVENNYRVLILNINYIVCLWKKKQQQLNVMTEQSDLMFCHGLRDHVYVVSLINQNSKEDP